MSHTSVISPGKTALITGGASGIGLALARHCAAKGMNVIICDNNAANLRAPEKDIGGKVTVVELDVSRVEGFEGLKKKVEGEFGGKIDLLVLNAGIMVKGTWSDTAYFHKIMDVNLFGFVNGLSSLLPLATNHSSAASPTSIIITGSKQGITNPPGNPAYNASKAAVKTLAEHLSLDLSRSHPATSVHLLVPGWTFTGLSGNAPFADTTSSTGQAKKEKPAGSWSPEQVVDFAVGKLAEGKFYIICPDNDVSEDMDRKRMLWDRLDLVKGRQPLSRWRPESEGEYAEWVKKTEF